MARHTSQSSTISSYYLTVLVAFLMTAVIATPMASSELSGGEGDTSGRSAYWQQGTVSFPDDAGKYNSIVVDENGAMHIAHINPTNGELLYSTNSSSTSWTTQNFTFGFQPAILQDGVEGKTAIAIDSEGFVNIAYRKANSSNNFVYDLFHMEQEASGSWIQGMISTGGDMGHHLSMTIDSNDTAHIAYRDKTNGKLRYAFNTTCSSCWNDDTVAMSSGTEISGGFHTSIATNSNNDPIIAQCNSHNGSLMLLQWVPSGQYWSMSYPDDQGKGCKHTSMEIYTPQTGGEEIHISYARDEDSDGTSELRYTTNKNSGWNGHTVDGSGLGSRTSSGMTSIAVDSVGAVHIAYSGNYVDADADLKYALKPSTSGSSWSTEVVSTENTDHVSIDVDSNDVPYISYLKSCGINCSELAYAKLIQTGGGSSELVNSNPYYNTTSDLLMGAWNASSLVSGTDYNATIQVYDSNFQLLNTSTHIWTQTTSSTVYEYNPPSGNPELTGGDTYCVKVTLYNGSDGSQLAMDETCVTIPYSESITSQLNYNTGTEQLWANYSAAALTTGNQYTVYYNFTNSENVTISYGNQTFTAPGSSYAGDFGSWPLNLSWMNMGSTYCMRYEVAHLGQSNYISSDESCVTIPSGSGSSESIISQINFDTTSLNLTADIDSSSLIIGESYEVEYFLWHSEDSSDELIDEGNETFTTGEMGNHELWVEWVLSSPENENGIDRGETYCLDVKLSNDGPPIATDSSCVTIPTSGGGGGSSWTMSVLQTERDEGFGSSMAINNDLENSRFDANIHVSYYDYENGASDVNLMYAFFDGTDWSTQTLDSGLGYASIHSTALDLDDVGCPVILYYSEDARQLRIKHSLPNSGGDTPCTWMPGSVVVATETSGTALDVYALYSLSVEGQLESLVTHISYAFYCENEPNWNGDLMYASFDESEDTEWQFETIATSSLTGFNSIKLDDNGNPHIAYYDADAKIVYYSYFDGSAWTTETIDNEVNLLGTGSILSLDLGPNWQNTASVAYVEANDSMLKLAVRSGGSWSVTSIADTNGGADNSLAFDENNYPNIAFTGGGTESDEQLRFAHYNGQEWVVGTIDNGGEGENRVGINPSLVYGLNGKPIVAHLDLTTGNLKFTCNGCSIFDGNSSGSGNDTVVDECEEWEYWNPELVDTSLPGNGCPFYIDESNIEVEEDEEVDWWVEIPVVGVLIEQVQTEYGRYISMATVGLAMLGWAYRAVTMRSDYKMEKRCRKFEKRIDNASSASELRSIQVEIEKAQKKGLILRGAYGDLLSRIEMRSEDLGLTDFITNDTLIQAGVSEMEFREGIEDLRAAKMELDMVRDDLERSRYEDSSSAQSKSPINLSDKVTNEGLSGTGKSFVSRPSYHPKDINQDGVVDEEDERLWQSMSEAERQSRQNKDVHLVSEIVAFAKIPISPKARCKCGSGKQFAKCHMKKVKCPCGSGRNFIRCCAKKRGYK